MNKTTRCLKILEILQSEGRVDVADLASRFETSDMTIRRDLNSLVKKYNITRTYGGATMPQGGVPIMKPGTFVEEMIPHKEQKDAIAKKAASLVGFRQRIYVDPGSTTRLVAEYLENDNRNVVITNSLTVVDTCLKYENVSTIMLGGEMLRISRCSFGDLAEEQVRSYRLDIAFIGAATIGTDGKLYDGYSPEARLKKTVIDAADKVYLLVDSSKFFMYDMTAYARIDQCTAVITDNGIDEKAKEFLRKKNIKLIIAE